MDRRVGVGPTGPSDPVAPGPELTDVVFWRQTYHRYGTMYSLDGAEPRVEHHASPSGTTNFVRVRCPYWCRSGSGTSSTPERAARTPEPERPVVRVIDERPDILRRLHTMATELAAIVEAERRRERAPGVVEIIVNDDGTEDVRYVK